MRSHRDGDGTDHEIYFFPLPISPVQAPYPVVLLATTEQGEYDRSLQVFHGERKVRLPYMTKHLILECRMSRFW